MKKINLFSCLLILSSYVIGQTNTFPASGNAGIGTTTPLEKLHIQGGNLLLGGSNSTNTLMGSIKFSTVTYNSAWAGIAGRTSNNGIDQLDLLFYTAYGSASEKMRLMAQSGFLGINTSTPAAQVHSMSTGEQLRLGYNATNYSSFTTSSTGGLTISPTGGTFNLAGNEIYFTGYQTGQNQNSNSLRLNFVGYAQKAGFGIQAINAGSYGSKDLVFYAHSGTLHNDYTSYDEVVRFRYNGKVGIGTSTPQAKLDVNGDIYSNGKIFIGTPDVNTTTKIAPYALAVNGSAVFTKAVVKLNSAWPDYVFAPYYNVPKLDSLEQFIKANGHLPEIPKAETVEKDGIDLGSNQALLLKKIEELTLIVIEQNKRIEKLEKELLKKNKEN